MAAIKPLVIDGSTGFWSVVNAAVSNSKLGLFSDDGLIYVAMSDMTKMVPFVRDKEELFSSTMNRHSKKYRVIINGQFYGLSNMGKADALMGDDPVDPSHTTPEGLVINDSKVVGGRAAPKMFYVANHWTSSPTYTFNSGSAPKSASSAIGGCGPVIINGMPYGETNKFAKGIVGKQRGEPIAKNKPHLKQRSNSTFSSFLTRPPYTGKTLIAHNAARSKLFALVLPHGASGISLVGVRNKLKKAGFENAIFLDGSDSSLLMVDEAFIAKAGSNKDETNTVGIGFDFGA
ncbi:phosphodiester glycosidase family protein [Pseudomonadota bacterium]